MILRPDRSNIFDCEGWAAGKIPMSGDVVEETAVDRSMIAAGLEVSIL